MDTICRRCFSRVALRSRRTFASIATPSPAEPSNSAEIPVDDLDVGYKRPESPYKLAASIVLSRAPVITRELSEFEKQFYFYQRRLDKRLAQPFLRNFYFKQGTLAHDEWNEKRKDILIYSGWGTEAWRDEMRLGDKPFHDENMDYDALVKYTVSGEDISAADTEEEIAAKKVMDKPLPRETEADINGDLRSLNRKLSKTLYLLVKRGDRVEENWKFPQSTVVGRENLRKCAESSLIRSCGRDMNYWMVGNAPIGYYDYQFPKDHVEKSEDKEIIGKKVFFMKARIFAGRPNIVGNDANIADYKWLTKDELRETVTSKYWKAIRHMLVER